MATFKIFGTTAVLLVTDDTVLGQARQIADAELAAVDRACSRFRPDSELSMLNGSHGAAAHISELFATLIAEALRAAELTDGDVDPTCGQALVALGYDRDFGQLTDSVGPGGHSVGPGGHSAGRGTPPSPRWTRSPRGGPARAGPAGAVPGWRGIRLDPANRTVQLARGAQLDLGATAKAWSADRCADRIAGRLGVGVLVSLGGDIAVAGAPPTDGWQVKATDDHAAPADAPGQTVTIRTGGLATSSTTVRAWTADGEARHHIIDPRTGAPAVSRWRTVTVAAATCADANIASTASIIRSDAAPGWLAELGLPARLVAHDGTVTTTPGWPTDPIPHP